MKTIGTLAIAACLALAQTPSPEAIAQEPAEPGFDHAHALWTEVVKEHVRGDRFDYERLGKNREKLDRYLAMLGAVERVELDAWTKEQRHAFWINAYNAYTVHLVVKSYPVESIKDIGSLLSSVWDKSFIPLGRLIDDGEPRELSLNQIEHEILRPRFKDARVHAAVNCASRGCPPLRDEAFVAERLDQQLDQQTRAWLADAARNRFEPDKRRVQISQIFGWFEEDFVRDAGSVRAWLARYGPPEHAKWLQSDAKIEVSHLDYSWELNDVERPKK